MVEGLKISKDSRKAHRLGNKVITEIHQVQEAPIENIKNMLKSYEEFNIGAKEYLLKCDDILEQAINTAKTQSDKMKIECEAFVNLSGKDKEDKMVELFEAELQKNKNTLEIFDKIVSNTIEIIKKQHFEQLEKVKDNVALHEEALKVYSKALR